MVNLSTVQLFSRLCIICSFYSLGYDIVTTFAVDGVIKIQLLSSMGLINIFCHFKLPLKDEITQQVNFVLTYLATRAHHVNSVVILATQNMCGLHNLILFELARTIFEYLINHISVLFS